MKACSKCGETKPLTEFSKNTKRRDWLQPHCKTCHNTANAKWQAANSEKIKARKAEYYAANPEKHRARVAKYRAENPVKARAAVAKWRAANPEKRKACSAKWNAANIEARRVYDQNRRARKQATGGQLSPGLAARLYKLQKGMCACCGQPLGDDYHLDHMLPLALGGANTDNNAQLLRSTCNLQKHARHPIDFMQSRGFLL